MTTISEREHFDQYGWCLLRQVIPRAPLRDLQQSVHRELSDLGVASTMDSLDKQPIFRPDSEEASQQAATTLPVSSRLEVIEHCAQDAALTARIASITETDGLFSNPNKWMRALPPADTAAYSAAGIHQDFPELQGSTNQVTLWAPIFEVSPTSGSLPLYRLPGTDRRPLPLQLTSSNRSGWQIDEDYLKNKSVFDLKPGDALLFSTMTPHGGSSNVGPGWRVSLEMRYQPLEDPIVAQLLERPFQYSDWQTLYDGWSEYAFYWADRHPEICQFDDSWERWRDVEAVKAGFDGDPAARRALEIAADFAPASSTQDLACMLLDRLPQAK